jgi:hypothetical protein
MYLIV